MTAACPPPDHVSSHTRITWGVRDGDTFYCVDILDENMNMRHQAVACGENLHEFAPTALGLPNGTYNWKIRSPSGYGGEGFEGSFPVP